MLKVLTFKKQLLLNRILLFFIGIINLHLSILIVYSTYNFVEFLQSSQISIFLDQLNQTLTNQLYEKIFYPFIGFIVLFFCQLVLVLACYYFSKTFAKARWVKYLFINFFPLFFPGIIVLIMIINSRFWIIETEYMQLGKESENEININQKLDKKTKLVWSAEQTLVKDLLIQINKKDQNGLEELFIKKFKTSNWANWINKVQATNDLIFIKAIYYLIFNMRQDLKQIELKPFWLPNVVFDFGIKIPNKDNLYVCGFIIFNQKEEGNRRFFELVDLIKSNIEYSNCRMIVLYNGMKGKIFMNRRAKKVR